jgi:hypothetical protein
MVILNMMFCREDAAKAAAHSSPRKAPNLWRSCGEMLGRRAQPWLLANEYGTIQR